ncbi:MAG: ATP-binding protein [Desulfuromonas sp.]|nr:ATP-binding protein [Desulfuromonas sp.]
MDNFEKKLLRNYLRNLLSNSRMTRKMFSALCDWLEDHLENIIVGEISKKTWQILDDYNNAIRNHSAAKANQKIFIAEMKEVLSPGKDGKANIPPSQLELSLEMLAGEMNLDEYDKAILDVIARYKIHDNFESLCDELGRSGGSALQTISLLTGLDQKVVSKRLGIKDHLVSVGLIQLKTRRGNDVDDRFALPDAIADALIKTSDNPDDIRTHILGIPAKAELAWNDFSHLGEIRTRLASFLKKSLQQRLSGINILLCGPPGTGKTEFGKTLAEQIGCSLFAVGETDNEGDEPDREERMEEFRLAQNLLRYQDNNLLMFDEMDDLFERSSLSALFGGKLQFSSKVFTNRLFEKNPVPTIWIINDVSSLDEAIVRRMSLVLEIKSPPKSSRQGVWNRILAKHELDLPVQAVDELMNLEVSPAILDNAVRFSRINGQGVDDILFATKGIVKAIKGSNKPQEAIPATSYCSGLVNADMNLTELGTHLRRSGQRRFSLCLYGPPGTGKTEYVRQLADQLGIEVLVKRASDLLGSYVGETERQIAAAFQEAQEKESFLVFDEADSLLGDRSYAQHGWEVSQVNEMLTWMESHPLPFACTTNLMERLDQASLRRFTFKVRFSYLTQNQVRLAFREFFSIEAPDSVSRLNNLTAGDFSVVQKKAEIIGFLEQPNELVKMLCSESIVKNNDGNRIGFMVA